MTMTPEAIETWRAKGRRIGKWMFIRYMHNRSVSLENAYFILFDKLMRGFRIRSAA